MKRGNTGVLRVFARSRFNKAACRVQGEAYEFPLRYVVSA